MSTPEGVGTARVRKEGRVTIPATVRDQLRLERGDFVKIRVERVEGIEDG